jgi:hypothetical protein
MTEPASTEWLTLQTADDATVAAASFTYRVSVALDAVAALAMAVGVAGGLWQWINWFGIAIGGALLTVIIYLAAVWRDASASPGKPLPPADGG